MWHTHKSIKNFQCTWPTGTFTLKLIYIFHCTRPEMEEGSMQKRIDRSTVRKPIVSIAVAKTPWEAGL